MVKYCHSSPPVMYYGPIWTDTRDGRKTQPNKVFLLTRQTKKKKNSIENRFSCCFSVCSSTYQQMVAPQSHTREKQQVMQLFERTGNDGISIMILL